jgi:iron complex outermembrane recepter protein
VDERAGGVVPVKKAERLALLLTLALLCGRAQAADNSVVTPSASKEGTTAKSKAKKATANGNKPVKMTPVVIKAKRIVPERLQSDREARKRLNQTPGAVGLVTRRHIERRTAATLADVLDYVPGVIAGTRSGADEETQISIRGSGLENTYQLWGLNLLQDGFMLNQADGFAYVQPVDVDFLQRIEIYKGANALRFGADSLGGAVNLVSKTGYDTPILESSNMFGSFGFMKNYVGSGQVIGPWDYYLGTSVTQQSGYRAHSNSIQTRVFPSIGYLFPSGATIRFDANYLHNDEKLPGELTLAQLESNPRQANPESQSYREWRRYDFLRTGLTMTLPIGEDQQLELYGQFIWHDLDHTPIYAALQGSTFNWNSEVRYVSTAPLAGHQNKLTAGIQYGGTIVHDLEYELLKGGHYGPTYRRQWDHALTVGVYAEDTFNLTPKLMLVAGGRMDYSHRSIFGWTSPSDAGPTGETDFFSGISPKLGFIYQLTPQIQTFGNISRAYQPPILLEEAEPVNPKAGLGNMDAEKAWQFELGTRGNWGERDNWDIAVYDYEIWHELQNVNLVPFPGATYTIPAYDNINRTRHTGVEFGDELTVANNLARTLGIRSLGDSLKARVAYTFSYFRFVNNPTYHDNQIPGITPENYLHGEVVYNNDLGFWLGPYVDSAMTHWAVNSRNTVYAPAYVLVGVRAGYDYRPWQGKPELIRFFFEGSNLTNATWVSAVAPDAGNGAYFDPGDGRAFYGGARFSF